MTLTVRAARAIERRGRGIGRRFVAALVAHARTLSPTAATFGLIAPDNAAMRGLAVSLGGTAGGEQTGCRVYRGYGRHTSPVSDDCGGA